MNPVFHKLQLTEVIAIPSLMILVYQILSKRITLERPKSIFYATLVFIIICFISVLHSDNLHHSLIEAIKLCYLFCLSILIYLNGKHYKIRDSLWNYILYGYLLIIIGGLLGCVLLLLGIPNSLAYPTKIIPLALSIENWIPFIPRVSSFLQPTANMLGAYLAIMTLPALEALFRRNQWVSTNIFRLIIIIIIAFLGFLTMSRTAIGVLLALYLGIRVLQWQIPIKRLTAFSLLSAAILGWILLLFFSVIYPVKLSIHYSHDTQFKKPDVVLTDGIKKPNPVYFLRKNVGLEKITVSLNYGIVHYTWLKYAGWEVFKQSPLLGVGLNNFSQGVEKLARQGSIPEPLSKWVSPQSQYFTLVSETGLLGTVSLLIAAVIVIGTCFKKYRAAKDTLSLCVALGLLVGLFIAIDIDILSFRWLWGLIAITCIPINTRSEHRRTQDAC